MSDEVVEYLKKPGNLEAALELQKIVQDVREKAFEIFWKNVEVVTCPPI